MQPQTCAPVLLATSFSSQAWLSNHGWTHTCCLPPLLTPAAVDLIWAAHTSTSLQETHIKQGSLTLDLVTGQASQVKGTGSGGSLGQVAHGVFMLVAFCMLMPATGLMARHKWWFYDPKVGCRRPCVVMAPLSNVYSSMAAIAAVRRVVRVLHVCCCSVIGHFCPHTCFFSGKPFREVYLLCCRPAG